MPTRIAIVGAGPSGLFLYKELVESGRTGLDITIFESGKQLGSGFPYSDRGAGPEHVTNVSANEIPDLVTPVKDWIQTVSPEKLEAYNIDPVRFNEYKVLPRLLFGDYLNSQFGELLNIAKKERIKTTVLIETIVVDIYKSADQKLIIKTYGSEENKYDIVAVCIGHKWPVKYEGKIPGYFDSPYPPAKLAIPINHAVAIKGASLTAIDAVSTLARYNGHFYRDRNGKLYFSVNKSAPDFYLHLHSLDDLLPAIRFHLEDSYLLPDHILTEEEVNEYIKTHNGFLSLDYIFRINFLDPLKKRDPAIYGHIKNMRLEEFVETVMTQREKRDPFELFKAEYEEAERSIKKEKSIPWKELLATLSFAVNYPAKHFSAEDMLRLTRVLKPLISIVIAFVPQGCADELIALYDAGRLKLIDVDKDSEVIPNQDGGIIYKYADESGNVHSVKYKTFIDCT
ncbi:MAG: FAD/NAD(P)-binding protein, partial [Chitinophagaceae bacterium]|nr:FAD/NAD(P)-binding protein [Chitinophagaceae bacterium]